MKKRGMGIMPDEIPEAEQLELVDLVWNAPEGDIMEIGEVFQWDEDWLPEIMGIVPCDACGELTAKASPFKLGSFTLEQLGGRNVRLAWVVRWFCFFGPRLCFLNFARFT